MKNYYSILGVTPDSTDVEIKSAYRALARKFHPDVNPDGAIHFKDITEAYETLSDSKKRLQYDTINGFFKTATKEKTRTSSNQAQAEYKKQAKESKTSQNSEKSVKHTNPTKKQEKFSKKINDIFKNFSKQKQEKEQPKRGADICEDISISLKEAIEGAERTINVLRTSECPHCKGRKFINGTVCSVCNGTGEKSDYSKISVKIPRNVKNGTKLRIKNEGNAGENGGKNGDLILKIQIENNPRISFEGNNIIYNIPITPFEAVLGGNISIPVFDGSVNLKIPAKTNSEQKFRLAGQGLKQNGKIGDMIVNVHIEIPCSLSDDEVRLYEKLKKLSTKNIRENLLNE